MREILFKAKRVDNGEWVEGFYHYTDWVYPRTGELAERKYYILPIDSQDAYEVDKDTICQYTGLADKNGCKIWENGIIKNPTTNEVWVIQWEDGEAMFALENDKSIKNFIDINPMQLEVIGNIFDNPELLGV